MVAFLDMLGSDLCKTFDSHCDATPQLNHLLRQALVSCSGGGRLDEEVNGPLELLSIHVNKAAGVCDCYWRQGHTILCQGVLKACL